MQYILPFLIFISSSIFSQGTYRWDVKIGVDTAGQRVYKMKPKSTSVSTLASKKENPRPEKKEIQKNLRADKEKRQVTVKAYVIALVEADDGDYHLVLKALRGGKTLVAEIPKPDQPKLKGFPGYKKKYADARDFVDNNIQKPTGTIKEVNPPVKVELTGYVFFDVFSEKGHTHSHGTAVENAIEIHPVLKIKKAK